MKRWMMIAALVAVLWTAPMAEAGGGGRVAVAFAVRRPVLTRSFAVQVGGVGFGYGRGVGLGLGYQQQVFARRVFFAPSYGYVPRQVFYAPQQPFYAPARGFDGYGCGGVPSSGFQQFAPGGCGCGGY